MTNPNPDLTTEQKIAKNLEATDVLVDDYCKAEKELFDAASRVDGGWKSAWFETAFKALRDLNGDSIRAEIHRLQRELAELYMQRNAERNGLAA